MSYLARLFRIRKEWRLTKVYFLISFHKFVWKFLPKMDIFDDITSQYDLLWPSLEICDIWSPMAYFILYPGVYMISWPLIVYFVKYIEGWHFQQCELYKLLNLSSSFMDILMTDKWQLNSYLSGSDSPMVRALAMTKVDIPNRTTNFSNFSNRGYWQALVIQLLASLELEKVGWIGVLWQTDSVICSMLKFKN